MTSAPPFLATEPRISFEEIEIRTADGVTLRAVVDEPQGELRGTVVLAHALLARKSSFGTRARPGLAASLARRGFRTIAFDFRGHGDSDRPDGWSYDDLVRRDLPAVADCARMRGEDRPVLVVGHSLGGHVALAAHGTGKMEVDAIVGLGANVWQRALEPSLVRWGAKRFVLGTMREIALRAGRFPARRLNIGSDDASTQFVLDFARITGGWTSADGADDYMAALPSVTIPFAAVLGDRDHLLCTPAAGEAFARRCAGPVEIFRADASHMELRNAPVAVDAVEWAVQRVKLPRIGT